LSLFITAPAHPSIYTLSLHDALPIFRTRCVPSPSSKAWLKTSWPRRSLPTRGAPSPCPDHESSGSGLSSTPHSARTCATSGVGRSEEHTSELQSRENLVCRLLLEKKK